MDVNLIKLNGYYNVWYLDVLIGKIYKVNGEWRIERYGERYNRTFNTKDSAVKFLVDWAKHTVLRIKNPVF